MNYNKQNLNFRVQEDTLAEIDVLAAFLKVRRSELIRDMIEYFRDHGYFTVRGKQYSYSQLVDRAKTKLQEEGASDLYDYAEQMRQKRASERKQKKAEVPSVLNELSHNVNQLKRMWSDDIND